MDKKISKDTPLNELTLRRYEKPGTLAGRALVRKLCLSLGILQPGDSRDVMVDILYVLLQAKKQKKLLSSDDVVERVIKFRKKSKAPMLGIAASNIRRQLLRLRDIFLVEKVKNSYRITEFLSLKEIFDDKIKNVLLGATLLRIEEYLEQVDHSFAKQLPDKQETKEPKDSSALDSINESSIQ